MAGVFFCFLGTGGKPSGGQPGGYKPAKYSLDGGISAVTEYVQVAEVELLQKTGVFFDRALIVVTAASKEQQFEGLRSQLLRLGISRVEPLEIREEFSAETQWEWFEQVVGALGHGDEITVDLTHGYRAIPIIFTAGLHFLARVKQVRLQRAFYGAFDAQGEVKPIVDLTKLFQVNEWAEGVSRLVEDGDARKLIEVAKTAPGFQSGAWAEPATLEKLGSVSDAVKNAEMLAVGAKAREALDVLAAANTPEGTVSGLLIHLIRKKFSPLVGGATNRGAFDRPFFDQKLAFIRMLLAHRLSMQAFTVFRETVLSLGLAGEGFEWDKDGIEEELNQLGSIFFRMVSISEGKWKFEKPKELVRRDRELPHYRRLDEWGVVSPLRRLTTRLGKIRNGFDHAWVGGACPEEDFAREGEDLLAELEAVLDVLQSKGLI